MLASRSVRRLPLVLAALVAAPLLLGACGSGSTPTTTADQPAATSAPGAGTTPKGSAVGAGTTTTEPDDDTTTTSKKKSTTTTEADGETTTTTKKSKTTASVTDDAYTEYCAVFVKYDKLFEGADTSDPSYFPQVKAAYQELTDVSPAEIHDDMVTFNEYLQGVNSVQDMIRAPKEIQTLGDKFDDITKEKCGVS